MSDQDGTILILVLIIGVLIFKPELLDFTKTDSPNTVPTNHAELM